jgi:HEAT repeat protein
MKTNVIIRASRFFLAALCLTAPLSIAVHADQSQFVNAKVETGALNQSLANTVQQIVADATQPAWIAYAVPAIPSDHFSCCNFQRNGSACGSCNLEEHGKSTVISNQNNATAQSNTVKLEQPEQVTVLLRIDQKQVMRIRVYSENCVLDADGLTVFWLTGVKAEESVAYLTRFVAGKSLDGDGDDHLPQDALMAIAQHADSSADRAYASFVALDQPASLREKASFWLGASRGKSGLALLEKMAANEPNTDVRAKVAFAMFVSHEPQATDDIIHMAKDDSDAHVRGQALFWLGQKAGQKASATITGAIQNDPDIEVKKKAVFALTQMPENEGVPKLIEVAQTNKSPEVRKQAMFWLGQSHDPRALAFFEKILSQ